MRPTFKSYPFLLANLATLSRWKRVDLYVDQALPEIAAALRETGGEG